MKDLKPILAMGGSVGVALAASACCIGPLLAAALGLGGAASLMALAPLRPWLLAVTALLLGGAFYLTYRGPSRACAPGEACSTPGAARAVRIVLWIATALALLAAAFPYYSPHLF